MDKEARTGDTVLVMTGRTQTLPWWLGGGVVKTTANKINSPVGIFVQIKNFTMSENQIKKKLITYFI
jgi:hypothetical protein